MTPSSGFGLRRVHYGWVVAAVAFVTLLAAAAFRAAPGPLMVPLHDELGWSTTTMSAAVSVNLVLYGLTAPFAAALMERFGLRRVTGVALAADRPGRGLVGVRAISLAAGVHLGPVDRSRDRVDGAGVRGDRRERVVRPAPRPGDGDPDRGRRRRPAGVPAAGRPRRRGDVLAGRVVAGRGRCARGAAAGDRCCCANRPVDVGLASVRRHDHRDPDHHNHRQRAAQRHVAIAALRQAVRTKAFWALAGAFAICGATTNGLIGIHFIPSAHDHGMATTTAAGLLAVVGLFDIAGTIVSGWLTDRIDPRLAAAGLLRLPRGRSAAAALAARRQRAPEHDRLHRRLRAGLGGDGAADRGAVPPHLRRPRHDRVRLGVRLPPARRRRRRLRRRRRPREPRQLHVRLARRGGPLRHRGRAVDQPAPAADCCRRSRSARDGRSKPRPPPTSPPSHRSPVHQQPVRHQQGGRDATSFGLDRQRVPDRSLPAGARRPVDCAGAASGLLRSPTLRRLPHRARDRRQRAEQAAVAPWSTPACCGASATGTRTAPGRSTSSPRPAPTPCPS